MARARLDLGRAVRRSRARLRGRAVRGLRRRPPRSASTAPRRRGREERRLGAAGRQRGRVSACWRRSPRGRAPRPSAPKRSPCSRRSPPRPRSRSRACRPASRSSGRSSASAWSPSLEEGALRAEPRTRCCEVAVAETAAALDVDRCFVAARRGGRPDADRGRVDGQGWRRSATRLGVARVEPRPATTAHDHRRQRRDRPPARQIELGGREVLTSLGSRAAPRHADRHLRLVVGVLARASLAAGRLAGLRRRAAGSGRARARPRAPHRAPARGERAPAAAARVAPRGGPGRGGELELDTVLQRLVDEVADLLGADAADCYLLDERAACCAAPPCTGCRRSWSGSSSTRRRALPGARSQRSRGTSDHAARRRAGAGAARGVPASSRARSSRRCAGGEGVRGDARRRLAAAPDRVRRGGRRGCSRRSPASPALALRNAEAFEERGGRPASSAASTASRASSPQPLSLAETVDAVGAGRGRRARRRLRRRARCRAARRSSSRARRGCPSRSPPRSGRARRLLDAALASALEDARVLASPDARSDDALRRGVARASPSAPGTAACSPRPWPHRARSAAPGSRSSSSSEERRSRRRRPRARAPARRRGARRLRAQRALRGGARGAVARAAARPHGRLLATELDPAAVLDEVVAAGAGLLVGADACAIRVVEDEELVVTRRRDGDGRGGAARRRARPRPAGSRATWCSRARRSRIEDVATDARLAEADPLLAPG